MTTAQPTRAALAAQLEEIWTDVDTLLNPLTAQDWQRKHGKDWIFADLPYHLAYYDQDIVATPLLKGSNLRPGEDKLMQTMGELDGWNARKFAERPAGQSVATSLAQMRAGREAVRHALATLAEDNRADEGLSNRVFVPLVGCGWVTARMAVQSCIVHTWAHFTEARLRLKKTGPVPGPAIAHTSLTFFMGMLPMMMNMQAAQRITLTACLEVGGAGGGNWTVHVENGTCTVAEERIATRDLAMYYADADTFLAVMRGMQNPLLAMLTGKVKIRGFQKMGLFGKLFAEPKPDQILQPLAV